jgi:uncharacterized protein YjiS (DUF1127 family)
MHQIMRAERAPAPAFGSSAVALLRHILSWLKRVRQRRSLAALDDWLLKDIGVSRADAMRECDKAFWQE